MRKRYNLSFNLADERHRAAHELLKAQPAKQQSEHVIGCILEAAHQEELLRLVKNALREVLTESGGVTVAAPALKAKEAEMPGITDDILSFLAAFQGEGDASDDPLG